MVRPHPKNVVGSRLLRCFGVVTHSYGFYANLQMLRVQILLLRNPFFSRPVVL